MNGNARAATNRGLPMDVNRPRVARAEGTAAGVVDGQTVVVSPLDLRYHALNATGTALWELLADGLCLDQFVSIGIAVAVDG